MKFEESLNKGVPANIIVDLRVKDLLDIVTDKEKLKTIIDQNFKKYVSFLNSIGNEFGIEYLQTMSVTTDKDTLEKKIIFSINGFYNTIRLNLNVNNDLNNYKFQKEGQKVIQESYMTSINKMLKRIEFLSEITTPQELEIEFPMLFAKYKDKISYYNQIEEVSKILAQYDRKTRKKIIRAYKLPNFEYLKEEAKNFSISVFVSEYATSFAKLLKNQNKIFRYLEKNPIKLDDICDDDKDKLELYFAYCHLENAKASCKYSQEYLYYVSTYFAENKDKLESNLSIRVKDNHGMSVSKFLAIRTDGDIVTPASLYDDYCNFLVKNPNLRAIDFSHLDFTGMTLKEVDAFMQEYLKDLSANWEFLPPDDRKLESEIINRIKNTTFGTTALEQEQHQKRLLELFMAKKALYDSSDPFFRIKGKNTFDGYVGYVYPNGRVVLDKFYDNASEGILADGHAVYAMSIQEFYELSKLSKSEIIRNNLCKRYVHRGNWTERVLNNEINADTSENPSVVVRELVRKGKLK